VNNFIFTNHQDAAHTTHNMPQFKSEKKAASRFYNQRARQRQLARISSRALKQTNLTSARTSQPYVSRSRISNKTPQASAFPQSTRTTLLYHASEVVTIGPAPNGDFDQWRITNPTDPDYTGTGHQPMGWDQWSEVYEDCHVLAGDISFEITTDTNNMPIIFTLRAVDIDASPTVVNDELERANCSHLISSYNGTQETWKLGSHVNVPSFLAKTRAEFLASTEFNVKLQNTTYNPTDQLIWALGYQYIDPAYVTPHSLYIKVVISYDCVFTNPRNFSAS